ncbi:hypothetical protein BTVI_115152 [Pitangus sulphuratus]|nr:hypothetical protein BTVI_115152 [Pitangus sulphuratus]
MTRGMENLSCKKSERTGIVQPGQEKLQGDLIVALPEEAQKKDGDYLQRSEVTGQGEMASNCQRVDLD